MEKRSKIEAAKIFKEHEIYSELFEAWRNWQCKDFIWEHPETGKKLFGFTEHDENGVFDLFVQEDTGDENIDTEFSLKIQNEWRTSFVEDLKESESYLEEMDRIVYDFFSQPIFAKR